jgi:SAM-dependent methyltransferase
MAVFIDIEDVPVHCGLLCTSRAEALATPKGAIQLAYCSACGMIYNLLFDPGRMQYEAGYDNSLHFSTHFQSYAQALAMDLIARYQIYGKHIIEIGCGQGEFLSLLCEAGANTGVGFDPSYAGDARPRVNAERVSIISDVYSEQYASIPADLICCQQVLEHMHQPREFLSTIRRCLGQRHQVPLFIEVPDVAHILHHLSVWDIIYEHCSYFSAVALRHLLAACGFGVRELYSTYDGQFLCVEAVASDATGAAPPDRQGELETLSREVAAFAARYQERIYTWQARLARLDQTSTRAVVWGAGARGMSFMSMVQCRDQIQYIVDINPRKQGMYLAGSGHQIVSPQFLQSYEPDLVIVMNPVYLHEIAQTIKELGLSAEVQVA